jgi:hypothetical protein
MKSFAKAGYKGENPKNVLMYNLAKRAKTRRKSVGLEVKLPANVMRTLDGDLKTEEEHIAAM